MKEKLLQSMENNTTDIHTLITGISDSITTSFDETRLLVYVVFGGAMLIMAIIQILLSMKHKADASELEKRKASNEAIRDFVAGGVGTKVDELKLALNNIGCKDYLWEHSKNFEHIVAMEKALDLSKPEDQATAKEITTIRLRTHDLLNYYEYLANGIAAHTFNEDIIHNFYALIFIDFRRWSSSLICEDDKGMMPWTQFADLSDKWENEFKKDDEAIDDNMDYLKKLKNEKRHKKLKDL